LVRRYQLARAEAALEELSRRGRVEEARRAGLAAPRAELEEPAR
jgi:hypothetical protein